MPKEYENCVRSMIGKGKSSKDAKRICAISYYKKHGKRPQDVHSSYEDALFTVIEAFFLDKLIENSRN